MEVNGVTSVASEYTSQVSSSAAKTEDVKAESKTGFSEEAAVFEKSDATAKPAENKYVKNPELVAKLKADAEERTSQLRNIVEQLLTKQAGTYDTSLGLKKLYENLEVDEETRAQAEKDIAEDGYWGVEQTSSRIFDFAMALSGGDPEMMEKMKDAFTKGFKQATKAWGDELPSISQKTAESVYKKFEDYQNSLKQAETVAE